jgi:hypothetical protein
MPFIAVSVILVFLLAMAVGTPILLVPTIGEVEELMALLWLRGIERWCFAMEDFGQRTAAAAMASAFRFGREKEKSRAKGGVVLGR